jgi:hypothetical protein
LSRKCYHYIYISRWLDFLRHKAYPYAYQYTSPEIACIWIFFTKVRTSIDVYFMLNRKALLEIWVCGLYFNLKYLPRKLNYTFFNFIYLMHLLRNCAQWNIISVRQYIYIERNYSEKSPRGIYFQILISWLMTWKIRWRRIFFVFHKRAALEHFYFVFSVYKKNQSKRTC